MKIEETVAYWSGITDPDSPAEQAAVALAKEVQRLRKEASRYIEALVHYDAWFGDECRCDDDPCPITAWNHGWLPAERHYITALAYEVQADHKLIADLRALHRSDGTSNPWCDHDGFSYPCPTIRLIDEMGL